MTNTIGQLDRRTDDTTPSTDCEELDKTAIIILVVGIVAGLALITLAIILIRRRRNKNKRDAEDKVLAALPPKLRSIVTGTGDVKEKQGSFGPDGLFHPAAPASTGHASHLSHESAYGAVPPPYSAGGHRGQTDRKRSGSGSGGSPHSYYQGSPSNAGFVCSPATPASAYALSHAGHSTYAACAPSEYGVAVGGVKKSKRAQANAMAALHGQPMTEAGYNGASGGAYGYREGSRGDLGGPYAAESMWQGSDAGGRYGRTSGKRGRRGASGDTLDAITESYADSHMDGSHYQHSLAGYR